MWEETNLTTDIKQNLDLKMPPEKVTIMNI